MLAMLAEQRQATCSNWPHKDFFGKEEMVETEVVWSQSM